LLNYVDPHFIGMENQGKDTLHTVNWKKSLQAARVTLDSPIQHGVPTTLSTVSEDQLMINGKGFSASNWLIYPGIPKARKTLRTLHEIAKEHKKSPTTKLTQTQVLDILYDLCWLNFYMNSIAKSRKKIKGLQALAFILRSDLNLILLMLKTSDLEKRALVLWDAEERLGYPTLRVRAAIMSRTTRDVFEPTNLLPKTLKLHKFKMRANYLVCMKTLKEATSYSVQACLYLVRCSSKEIKAQWPKHKQDKNGVWKDGILYSKNRWCDLLELDGVEPFTSVKLREQVPVI
jgi:hypothetical protein